MQNVKQAGNFFVPFQTEVWMYFGLLLLLTMMVLKIISDVIKKYYDMDRHDLYEFFVYTVGGIAQQGEWERL